MSAPLHAFGGVGIEVEYMIVDRDTLNVLPVADRLLAAAPGSEDYEVAHGEMGWSNELVMHVVEVKNLEPAPSLDALPAALKRSATRKLIAAVQQGSERQVRPDGHDAVRVQRLHRVVAALDVVDVGITWPS